MHALRLRSVLTIGVLSAGAVLCSPAMAAGTTIGSHTITANIGIVSNYISTGVTNSDDGPAIQGGLDYTNDNGIYAGLWASSVDFGDTDDASYELDLYTGFARDITDDLSYDIGVYYYTYPDLGNSDWNYASVLTHLTYKLLTVGVDYTFYSEAGSEDAYTVGDLYYHAALDFDLPFNLGLNLHGGYYDFRATGYDYGNWGASLSRDAGEFGTFSLNYDQISRPTASDYDKDPTLWIGWNKEF